MVDIYKINSVRNQLKDATQENILNKEALNKKFQEQKHMFNELWWKTDDQIIKKLTENTQEIIGLVEKQNNIIECAFSLNGCTLNLLEDLSNDMKDLRGTIKDLTKTKEIFRY